MSVLTKAPLLLALAASPALAGNGGHAIDLTPYLEHAGLTTADLLGAATAIVPADARWVNGLFGKVKRGYFALRPVGGTGRDLTSSLRFDFKAVAEPAISVQACTASGGCQPVEIQSEARNLAKFKLDGVTWEVAAERGLCDLSLDCSATLPSWSLENRRHSDGAIFAFPRLATFVQLGSGLAVINAETGAVWETWAPAESFLAGAGALKSAAFNASGQLELRFSAARMLLDFETDRMVRADDKGIAVADGGIGALGTVLWKQVAARPGGSSAPLLALSAGLAVWADGFAAYGNGSASEFQAFDVAAKTASVEISANGVVIRLAALKDGVVDVLQFNDGKRVFERQQSLRLPVGPTPTGLALMPAGVLALGLTGPKLVADGSVAATSLGVDTLTFGPRGQAFIERTQAGKCTMSHVRQDAVAPAAFIASGLTAPCGAQTTAGSAGSSGATVTTRSGVIVTVFAVEF